MLKVLIIAGENSGDILGSKIMSSLKKYHNEAIKFEGIGGRLMCQQGIQNNLIPFEDLSVMGIFEILPKIPKLLRHLSFLRKYITLNKPDILITIDSPDFNFRLVSKLKDQSFLKIHVVAPSVWAWRPGRAKKISKLYDHLFTLFPFEGKFFSKYGLESTFIGNPIVENILEIDRQMIEKKINLNNEKKILLFLPGSRENELNRMLPIYTKTSIEILKKFNFVKIIYMVPEEFLNKIESYISPISELNNKDTLIISSKYKNDIFRNSYFAIATSGTITLELAISKIPSIVCYKMSQLTYIVLKRLVKIKWISLPNIILNKCVYPEFIQNSCTVENLYNSLSNYLLNDELYLNNKRELEQLKRQLSVKNNLYSEIIPEIIFKKLKLNI